MFQDVMSRKIRNIVGLTFTFISRSQLYGSSICRPSLLDRRAKTKCNRLFTDILYETYAIGVFRCQEADLVPFSCFISLLVAKYNNYLLAVKVRQAVPAVSDPSDVSLGLTLLGLTSWSFVLFVSEQYNFHATDARDYWHFQYTYTLYIILHKSKGK